MVPLEDALKQFADFTGSNNHLRYILSLLRETKVGRVFLIGSAVYEPLASFVYGVAPEPQNDFDLVTEDPGEFVRDRLPSDGLGKNMFGNIKLKAKRGDGEILYSVNVIPYTNLSVVKRMGSIGKDMEVYRAGVPLNVQAVSYDIGAKKLKGPLCIDAITKGVIRVNDVHEFTQAAGRTKFDGEPEVPKLPPVDLQERYKIRIAERMTKVTGLNFRIE